jgi:hypothetical protein
MRLPTTIDPAVTPNLKLAGAWFYKLFNFHAACLQVRLGENQIAIHKFLQNRRMVYLWLTFVSIPFWAGRLSNVLNRVVIVP